MHKLALLSLLFTTTTTTTLALPQASCFAGVCLPNVPYGSPLYDDWAKHEVEKWKDAELNRNLKKNKNRHPRDVQAAAAPVTTVVKAQDPEEPWAGVYYCEDNAWGGACKHVYSPLGSDPEKCTMMDNRVSSVGPDPGYYCIFYTNAFCAPIASDGSDSLTLTYPGSDNLGFTEKGDFNDRLLSYHCFKEEAFALKPEIGTPPNAEGKTE